MRSHFAVIMFLTGSFLALPLQKINAQDTTPPTVSISSPLGGATVRGTITVTATAADNVGIAGVQFLVDGIALGAEITSAPYNKAWYTTPSANGVHALSARVRDKAGNTTTSNPVTVTVDNASASTAFSFVVYGDSNANTSCQDNADHVNLVNRMVGANPAFVLHVGDMIAGYLNTTNWTENGGCLTPGSTGSFKDMIAPLASRPAPPGLPTSYFPVIGNHDDTWGSAWYPDPYGKGVCDAFGAATVRSLVPNHTRQAYFRDKTGRNYPIYTDEEFYNRLCSTSTAAKNVYPAFLYYSFDYNDSHFVVMRVNSDYYNLRASNPRCTASVENNYDTCYNIHQLHWLQDDLAKAKANPNIKHIFGFLHAPVFTTGDNHPANKSWQYISPEFSKVNADIVFTGHNHIYERTVPIYATSANPGGVQDDNLGTVYVVTGGGGSPLIGFNAAAWFDVTRTAVKHFVKVTVSGDQVLVQAIDINGNVIDNF